MRTTTVDRVSQLLRDRFALVVDSVHGELSSIARVR